MKALIDTGAEVSLVRQGLFPPSFFKISPVPLKILGANEHRVGGGTLETFGHLEALATENSDRKKIFIRFPTRLIEADVLEDIILSHEWLASFKINVRPYKHDLLVDTEGLTARISGLQNEKCHYASTARLQTRSTAVTSTDTTRPTVSVSVATSSAAM